MRKNPIISRKLWAFVQYIIIADHHHQKPRHALHFVQIKLIPKVCWAHPIRDHNCKDAIHSHCRFLFLDKNILIDRALCLSLVDFNFALFRRPICSFGTVSSYKIWKGLLSGKISFSWHWRVRVFLGGNTGHRSDWPAVFIYHALLVYTDLIGFTIQPNGHEEQKGT